MDGQQSPLPYACRLTVKRDLRSEKTDLRGKSVVRVRTHPPTGRVGLASPGE